MNLKELLSLLSSDNHLMTILYYLGKTQLTNDENCLLYTWTTCVRKMVSEMIIRNDCIAFLVNFLLWHNHLSPWLDVRLTIQWNSIPPPRAHFDLVWKPLNLWISHLSSFIVTWSSATRLIRNPGVHEDVKRNLGSDVKPNITRYIPWCKDQWRLIVIRNTMNQTIISLLTAKWILQVLHAHNILHDSHLSLNGHCSFPRSLYPLNTSTSEIPGLT